MAGPFEMTPEEWLISVTPTTGEILDKINKSTHGGPLFLAGGIAMDVVHRGYDKDGFTWRDTAAVAAGVLVGGAVGVATGPGGGSFSICFSI